MLENTIQKLLSVGFNNINILSKDKICIIENIKKLLIKKKNI